MSELNYPDACSLIMDAIDRGDLLPGDRLVETDLAAALGVSRTPIREALGRLETQGVLIRNGRSLSVAKLDHDQLGELYEVRTVVEGLAARLAARHAAPEEIQVLRAMVEADRSLIGDGLALNLANKRFHRQLHLASRNRYLNSMLQSMRRSLALLGGTTLSDPRRGVAVIEEHDAIIRAIEARDEDAAEDAARIHISMAYRKRLELESAGIISQAGPGPSLR